MLVLLLLLACHVRPSTPDTGPEDADQDGVAASADCDDADPTVGMATTWHPDADGDGFGDASRGTLSCEPEAGLVADDTDCDDRSARIHPDATEDCDDVDNDCDGEADEDCDTVCGDGIVEGLEDCDGAVDDACPGLCTPECACPAGPTGELRIEVVDVGQGDAILVVSPDGFSMLVDAGPTDSSLAIEDAMDDLGLTDLNYTLLTHTHLDHMGSLGEVVSDYPGIDACYDHGHSDSGSAWRSYTVAAAGRRRTLAKDDTVDLGPSVQVDVLHAWTGDDNENDNSIVLRITYGVVTVLLGGDCEGSPCEESLQTGPITFYKVDHHGSSDSSSQGLLDAMKPALAVIPVGVDNDYGHPDPTTLYKLDRVGATTLRTDENGDILFATDGATWNVTPERW